MPNPLSWEEGMSSLRIIPLALENDSFGLIGRSVRRDQCHQGKGKSDQAARLLRAFLSKPPG